MTNVVYASNMNLIAIQIDILVSQFSCKHLLYYPNELECIIMFDFDLLRLLPMVQNKSTTIHKRFSSYFADWQVVNRYLEQKS